MNEIYIRTDVETDGPIPGSRSMAQHRLAYWYLIKYVGESPFSRHSVAVVRQY